MNPDSGEKIQNLTHVWKEITVHPGRNKETHSAGVNVFYRGFYPLRTTRLSTPRDLLSLKVGMFFSKLREKKNIPEFPSSRRWVKCTIYGFYHTPRPRRGYHQRGIY